MQLKPDGALRKRDTRRAQHRPEGALLAAPGNDPRELIVYNDSRLDQQRIIVSIPRKALDSFRAPQAAHPPVVWPVLPIGYLLVEIATSSVKAA